MTVDTECRKSLLRVSCQNGCKVNCAGALSSVEAPNCLYGLRVHIHSLGAVAPAGGYGKGDRNALTAELLLASRRLCDSTDGGVSNNYLYGLAVGILKILLKELCRRTCHVHGLVLKSFSYLKRSSSTVDRRTDTDYGIAADKS